MDAWGEGGWEGARLGTGWGRGGGEAIISHWETKCFEKPTSITENGKVTIKCTFKEQKRITYGADHGHWLRMGKQIYCELVWEHPSESPVIDLKCGHGKRAR